MTAGAQLERETQPLDTMVQHDVLTDLKQRLDQFNVTTDTWGRNGAKTIEDLLQEIEEGDCQLVEIDGALVRITKPIFINVIYKNAGVVYECFESENKRGRRRVLPGTFGEKGLTTETVGESLARAMTEEVKPALTDAGLSFDPDVPPILKRTWTETVETKTYPGLPNRAHSHLFVLTLRPNQGEPQDFQLTEPSGTTSYSWRVITN